MAKRITSRVVKVRKAPKQAPLGQGDAKVGRGKPPVEKRFKKGVSGNPKGRPKGSKNLATYLTEAAYARVGYTAIDGKKKKLSRIQATTLQLANKAARGDPKSMLDFMKWVDEIEHRQAEARPADMPIGEADLKVLQAVYERMKQCKPPKE